jgi:hypothetical protein
VATGKRSAGAPFARRCAVYGAPAQLTTEQELWLDLNVEHARALQAHTVVEGSNVAAGGVGPWNYYLMLAGGDETRARRMMIEAHRDAR